MIDKSKTLTINTAKANARRGRQTVTVTQGLDSDSDTYYSEVQLKGASSAPDVWVGHLVLMATIAFFIIGSYAMFFSAFVPQTGFIVFDTLARDTHYKYFVVLLVPTTAYFVIANWVGWQYYRNS